MSGLALAPSLRAETLEDALSAAYAGNPALQAQRAQLRATDELVPEAKANWRPTVTVNGDAGYEHLEGNTFSPPLSRDQKLFARDASVSISQPIYRGGRTDAQIAQAEAQVQAGRALLGVTEQTVLLSAVGAYLDVIQDQAVVDLNKNNEQVLQRQLDATNDRFRVGEVTRTDTSQAQAAVSGAHAARRAAEGVLQGAIANYERIVGHLPKGLEAASAPSDLPASLEAARGSSDANPAVAAQRFAVEAAERSVDVAEGALLPTVSVTGSYGRTLEESYTGSGLSATTALVNLSIPIYQKGAEYATIRQQKHTVGQQKLQLDETRREVIEATTQAWENLQAARARVQSLEDQVKANRVALEGVQRESLVGSRTVLDVLTTEQDLLNSRVNLEQARHDAVLAAYQVKSQVGQLTAAALHLSTPYYDPKAHYNEVTDKWIGTEVSPSYGEVK
jgi:outer membrane protein